MYMSLTEKLIFIKRLRSKGGGGVIKTLSGTLPLTFTALAKHIISLIQYGKTEQAGTPTPSAPVDIVCNNGAVKWGASGTNLLDMAEENIRLRYYINDSGVETSNNQNFYNTKFIPVKPNTAYTLSVSEPVYYTSIMEYDSNKGFLQRTLDGSASEKHSSTTFTTRADTAYILIGSNPNRTTMSMDDVASIDWMLNEGSTALPYEPYTEGIIADGTPEVLTVGEQTASVQNLYQVGNYADTQDVITGVITRRVGMKVLDGTENWTLNGTMRYVLTISDMAVLSGRTEGLCTHFSYARSSANEGTYFLTSAKRLFMHTDFETVADWKAYLAAQYAAGTPVIVLYPLAEEETESVTPQPLKTVAGSNTISVTAEVSGIEVDIQYRGEE